ncbi:MAG: tRNA (guanosine(46)-N7)-methyltransferase TrmB [bacterium]|nr:tRNA (guanosine(46)-N7)-methyltransferase TrmB [bacterium]
MAFLNPADFIITRKRKLYKFALFNNSSICFEFDEWQKSGEITNLEIGAGTGLFSEKLALKNPSKTFLAVDIKADRLVKGAIQAEKDGVKNIRFLRARGDQLLEIVDRNSVKHLWITFPDPYPRSRNAGRRLTHPTFLKIYAQLLAEGGALYFKTDALELFQWSLEQLVAEGWTIDRLSFDLHESDLNDNYKVMTTYEERFVGAGLKINFVRAIPPKNQ